MIIDIIHRIARRKRRRELPRRTYWMAGDDLYYLASTGEWAIVQEDEEGRAVGLLLAPAGPRTTVHPYPLCTSIQEVRALVGDGPLSMSDSDVTAELRHHDDLRGCAARFEAAPSGHWAVVVGIGQEFASCHAVGETPEEARANATLVEVERDPDIDAEAWIADMLARAQMVIRPCARRFLSAHRLDQSTVAYLDKRGYVDLHPRAHEGTWDHDVH